MNKTINHFSIMLYDANTKNQNMKFYDRYIFNINLDNFN